jgi:FkbM family methyltransferase
MSERKQDFVVALMEEVVKNSYNHYGNNYDTLVDDIAKHNVSYRAIWRLIKGDLKKRVISVLSRYQFLYVKSSYYRDYLKIEDLKDHLEGLNETYNLLSDRYSRELLLKLFAYRILGRERVALPLYSDRYWEKRREVLSLISSGETISVPFLDWQLSHFCLNTIGYDIRLFSIPFGILVTFVFKQYEYHRSDVQCKAQNGDYVIDAGGCWGDSALYFAHEVGEKGKVYTFEFIPGNLLIMKKNMQLNPRLNNRIDIIEYPLWHSSGQLLYAIDDGPRSLVSNKRNTEDDREIATISIDDFVTRNNIGRVDLIKMDIEGGELEALEGARETIRKFRPKLAIAVYHNLDHLTTIPNFITSLRLDYRLYLDNFTLAPVETVLFAVPYEI